MALNWDREPRLPREPSVSRLASSRFASAAAALCLAFVALFAISPLCALSMNSRNFPSISPLEATDLVASSRFPLATSARVLAKKSTSPCSLVAPVPWAACGDSVGGEEATGAWAVMATLMIEILSADYIVLTAQYDMTKSVLL